MANPRIFDDEGDFAECLEEYLEHCRENPIAIQHPFNASGVVIYGETFKPRVPTMQGFLSWVRINKDTYYKYKKRYPAAAEQFENYIYDLKYTNAAAGTINSNIVIRDLGLADSVKNEVTGKDGEAIQHEIKVSFDD